MVTNRRKHSEKTPVKQGSAETAPGPNKINASTPYDFSGKNLTPYGGLLPVITMLERLGFQSLVEQTLTSKRIPHTRDLYRFVLAIVLGLYIGVPVNVGPRPPDLRARKWFPLAGEDCGVVQPGVGISEAERQPQRKRRRGGETDSYNKRGLRR